MFTTLILNLSISLLVTLPRVYASLKDPTLYLSTLLSFILSFHSSDPPLILTQITRRLVLRILRSRDLLHHDSPPLPTPTSRPDMVRLPCRARSGTPWIGFDQTIPGMRHDGIRPVTTPCLPRICDRDGLVIRQMTPRSVSLHLSAR